MNDVEPVDSEQFSPGFGKGGVPWYLLLFYLSFLSFFTWYVLEYQLVDFLDQKEAVRGAQVDGE